MPSLYHLLNSLKKQRIFFKFIFSEQHFRQKGIKLMQKKYYFGSADRLNLFYIKCERFNEEMTNIFK